MAVSDIFVKTEKGIEELKTRSAQLPQSMRMMLIVIDGTVPAGRLVEMGAKLGLKPDFLDMLLLRGLVAAVPPPLSRRAAAAAAAAAAGVELPMRTVGGPSTLPPPIAPASPLERFQSAKKVMNDAIVDAVGLRAFFFTLKLERCGNAEDLRALLPEFQKAITKALGAPVAEILAQQVQDRLG